MSSSSSSSSISEGTSAATQERRPPAQLAGKRPNEGDVCVEERLALDMHETARPQEPMARVADRTGSRLTHGTAIRMGAQDGLPGF